MPKYYLLDENNNLIEGFDKEGFLAIMQQAIDEQSLENIDPESAVASKLRSVVNGTAHSIEFVTQAQYNQLEADEQLVPNTYYFITDDQTEEDLENAIAELQTGLAGVQEELTPKEWQSVSVSKTSGTNIDLDRSKNYKLVLFKHYQTSEGLSPVTHIDTYELGTLPALKDDMPWGEELIPYRTRRLPRVGDITAIIQEDNVYFQHSFSFSSSEDISSSDITFTLYYKEI